MGYYSTHSNSPTSTAPISFVSGSDAAVSQAQAAHGSGDIEDVLFFEEGHDSDSTQDAPGVASSQGFPPYAQPTATSAGPTVFGASIAAAADPLGQPFAFDPQLPAMPAVQPVPQPFSFGPAPGQHEQQSGAAGAQQQPGAFGQQAPAGPSYGSFGGFGVQGSAVDGHLSTGRPTQRRGHAKPAKRGGR